MDELHNTISPLRSFVILRRLAGISLVAALGPLAPSPAHALPPGPCAHELASVRLSQSLVAAASRRVTELVETIADLEAEDDRITKILSTHGDTMTQEEIDALIAERNAVLDDLNYFRPRLREAEDWLADERAELQVLMTDLIRCEREIGDRC